MIHSCETSFYSSNELEGNVLISTLEFIFSVYGKSLDDVKVDFVCDGTFRNTSAINYWLIFLFNGCSNFLSHLSHIRAAVL